MFGYWQNTTGINWGIFSDFSWRQQKLNLQNFQRELLSDTKVTFSMNSDNCGINVMILLIHRNASTRTCSSPELHIRIKRWNEKQKHSLFSLCHWRFSFGEIFLCREYNVHFFGFEKREILKPQKADNSFKHITNAYSPLI